jgi:hypothetical protein
VSWIIKLRLLRSFTAPCSLLLFFLRVYPKIETKKRRAKLTEKLRPTR